MIETVSCGSLPQNLDVSELMIENNSDLTLRSFTSSNLNVLKLHKCCRLEISENESDLLKPLYTNNNLKELVIIGCDNVNGFKPSWQRNIEPIIILQIVVNNQNNIQKLTYKFESVPCLNAINTSNNVKFIVNSTLETLNLHNNTCLNLIELQELLKNLINLKNLDIRGFFVSVIHNLDFSMLKNISEIKLTLHQQINKTLKTVIELKKLKYILIEDTFSSPMISIASTKKTSVILNNFAKINSYELLCHSSKTFILQQV